MQKSHEVPQKWEEFTAVTGGRVAAQAVAVLHLAPPVERYPSCVLLLHLTGEGWLQIG